LTKNPINLLAPLQYSARKLSRHFYRTRVLKQLVHEPIPHEA